MRRAVFSILFASLVGLAWQTAPSPQTRELAPGVFLRAAEPAKRIIANAGWVVFRDYVLVIDANYPWGARAILDDIRKSTNKPVKYVFDTHYHGDHAHGNGVFVDASATIICSAACAEESRRKNPEAWQASAVEYQKERLEHPQIAFPDKMVFDDGTHRVELIKVGPGHTLGDSVAWLPIFPSAFEKATGHRLITVRGPSMGDSPEAIPTRLARGEAEIGFQQVSESIHVAGITYVGTLPPELQPLIYFSGAITRISQQPAAALALIRFLSSPQAAAVITKAGLAPLSAR